MTSYPLKSCTTLYSFDVIAHERVHYQVHTLFITIWFSWKLGMRRSQMSASWLTDTANSYDSNNVACVLSRRSIVRLKILLVVDNTAVSCVLTGFFIVSICFTADGVGVNFYLDEGGTPLFTSRDYSGWVDILIYTRTAVAQGFVFCRLLIVIVASNMDIILNVYR